MSDQPTLATRIMQLQLRTGCDVAKSMGFSWSKMHPHYLESELRYYIEEYPKLVAQWQARLDRDRDS